MTTNNNLNNELNKIIEDLQNIFSLDEIDIADINNIINNLRSKEVKAYIQNLCEGSKPESALRETLFTTNSPLAKYLYGYTTTSPEVKEDGYVDYLVKDQLGHIIVLELKSPFSVIKDKDKSGKSIIKKLKQEKLNWENYKDQIKKYINIGEYVILTNLKEWVFFSRSLNPNDPKPFHSSCLSKFIEEYKIIKNLKEYADRKEYESIRYELDKKFLDSLKAWVNKLSEIEFNADIDGKKKLELIIGLINKFIFIQTLDDYGIIEFKWIQNKWSFYEKDWFSKGKLKVLNKFLDYVNEFFFQYYDTELFTENFLDYVKKEDQNIERLYYNFKMVLGLSYLQTQHEFRGIIQYNFRLIDEDILGKAYENFLAEERKEHGAYYTPKYITEYIVANTVGKIYDELLKEIKESLEYKNFNRTIELVKKFTSIKVLDPACGSGSFLIKALRTIKNKYFELYEIIEDFEKRYCNYSSLDFLMQDELKKINEIKNVIVYGNNKKLISLIILRHIYGNDLDRRALEVAKVNIWLEAIKLSPSEFRYDRLPCNIEHVLPDLRMNFGNGDSLISLPHEDIVNYLSTHYKNELSELSKLRYKYLNEPTNTDYVEKIEKIKQQIRDKLDQEFCAYLSNKSIVEKIDLTRLLSLRKPFYWQLEFWFAYFDEKGEPLIYERSGFDVIIGNPPYGRIKQLIKDKKAKAIYSKYFDLTYSYQRGNYNYYKLFLERCFNLLTTSGYFSMIFPTAFLGEHDSQPLRKLFFENAQILKILQFPEKTRVFSDVTQDVIVLVYKKSKTDTDYSFKIRTNISDEELMRLNELEFLELKVSEIKGITGGDYRIPLFTKPIEEWAILRKISNIPPFKGDSKVPRVGEIGVGHLDETFDKDYLSQNNTGDLVVKGIHLDQFFVNLDPDGPKPRWVRKNDFLRKKPEAKENIKYERIIGRNTLNRMIRPRLKFTLLPASIVITNAIKYIILTCQKSEGEGHISLDKYYVIGLLNSSLLNWRFELFSSQNNIRNYEIEDLPFYRANVNTQSIIGSYVKRIIELKQTRYMWFKLWERWQITMKNDERTLEDILLQDLDSLRYGRIVDLFSSNATVYPKSNNELLNKQFNEFEVIGNDKMLNIYGILEDEYKLICSITFTDERLMRIVYASIYSLLESDSKPCTLSQLYQKTKIPIIKPNIKHNTVNILLKVECEFENWKKQNGFDAIPSDIIEIDNEMNNLITKVDYLVFQLYGLNKNECKVVLDSLKVRPTYRDRILKHFEGVVNV
jgi:Alw26I/Eco31I/Esp3I family type II restriction m6 adenine DNA methyltransferase